MKKTVFTIGIALLTAIGAWAQTTFTVNNLKYKVTDETTQTVEVTGYESGLAREMNIPATVTHEGTTYNVTSIGDWVFYECNTITAVTIPGSVTSIGKSTFRECEALTTVTISEGVTAIKQGAFYECSALTAITIPESVTSIGESAFGQCIALTTINIPTNLTKIEKYTFEGCKALTAITIPESVTSIGESAFNNCTSLTQINVDENNTAFCSENGVLFNKDKTTLICYPAAKTETTYTVPATVTTIGINAFAYCSAITQITLPEGLTNIEDRAFRNCTALTTINIPASLTSIGNNVFSGCTAITQIDADAANTAFCSENGILFNKDKTTLLRYPAIRTETTYTVPNSVTIIEKSAFEGNTALTQITIPNNLTKIGDNVFKGCTALTIVNIGSGVTSIGYAPFEDCPALTQINVDAANTTYSSESGVLFSKDKTRLICYPAGKPEANYTAPASLTRINMMAFRDCTALTEITLPEGMTTISVWAFVSCTALTTINIPASLTDMKGEAFLDCTALMEFNVDEGNTAFCSENGVLFNKDKTTLLRYPSGKTETAYTVPNTVTTIGTDAFDHCTALTTVTLPESLTYIRNYAFDGCTAIRRITIPANTTEINAWAFRNCTAITQMTVLATVPPTIWGDSFEGVSRDIPVYVPAEALADYRGAKAWNDFTNLQGINTTFTVDNLTYEVTDETAHTVEVTGYETEPTGALDIPATVTYNDTEYTVTSIREFAFYACDALTEVTIPASVTSIGKQAFCFCEALTAINVADDNTAYSSENGVLFNKDKTTLLQYPTGNPATTYTIPASVTNIETTAFSYCKILTAINVADGNTAYSSENGVLFNKDKTTLLLYPIGNPATTYTVPDGVTSINGFAFYYCSVLTTVTIPNSVTGIGKHAFNNCRALTTVNMGSGLTSIENYAFYECTALTQMTVLATVPPTIENSFAFYRVSRDIPVYVPAEALADYQAANTWSEFNLQALPASNLQTATMPESIRMEGGMLHNPQQLHMTLYDMQGRQVYSGNDATLSLTTGIYVMRCEGASCKVRF